jgi:excisionase family DNA binding protein
MKRTAPVAEMQLLSLEALEARSMISRHTWRKWLHQRRLPAVRLGSRLMVAAPDFEKFIATHRR